MSLSVPLPHTPAAGEISQSRHRSTANGPVELAVRVAGRPPHPGWGPGGVSGSSACGSTCGVSRGAAWLEEA